MAVSRLKLVATAAYLLLWPALLLGLSGDRSWLEGWLFSAWFVALCATSIAWLYRRDPALLEERYRKPGSGGQSRGDVIAVAALVVGFIAWIVVPALDARFGWTHVPRIVEPAGGALLLAASFLLFRSFTDNTYLSPLVRIQGRIQGERAQQVVTTGVYAFVRHPMYLGACLMFVGGPLLLGSAWGLAVGGALVIVLAVRIVGEERVLAQLDGYDAYRAKVRYRLVPGVW